MTLDTNSVISVEKIDSPPNPLQQVLHPAIFRQFSSSSPKMRLGFGFSISVESNALSAPGESVIEDAMAFIASAGDGRVLL